MDRKTLINLAISTAAIFLCLLVFSLINYIDPEVVKLIYLPLYLLVVLAILLKKFSFGRIFTAFIILGLLTEYLLQVKQKTPSLGPAFVNVSLIFLGFILGLLGQVYQGRKNK